MIPDVLINSNRQVRFLLFSEGSSCMGIKKMITKERKGREKKKFLVGGAAYNNLLPQDVKNKEM